jgi:hypothetical protein
VSQVIAPVYRAVAFDPEQDGLSSHRVWHRERKYDRDVLPEPGVRYFRYAFALPDKEIQSAKVLISVDHAYTLHFNGSCISRGSDWRKVDKLDVLDELKAGDNIIAIEARNEGTIANPAGILFALKIIWRDGEERIIQSGTDWLSTDEPPDSSWIEAGFVDRSWQHVRNYGGTHWDKLVNFAFDSDGVSFARASLVRQDPFMKALGRPSRENVATTRDERATLLQALALTNGEDFNNIIAEGADKWLQQYDADAEKISQALYTRLFGRPPGRSEMRTIEKTLGEQPDREAVQDLLWATLLLPEFQFIF